MTEATPSSHLSSRPRTVGIVTARGGSKGLPGKNLALLGGRPLITHTVAASRDCPLIDSTVVTTDDADIAAVAREAGAKVVMRPAELAGDAARSQDAVRHCLDSLAAQGDHPEILVLLQPTSPLRTARHIEECMQGYLRTGAGSAISVAEETHSPFKAFLQVEGMLRPLFSQQQLSAPRQSLPRVFRQNGAIYVVGVDAFLREDSFFVEPAWPYEMSECASIDIDTHYDLSLAEFILSSYKHLL